MNSIDYLLKPIDRKELFQAMDLYARLSANEPTVSGIANITKILSGPYKSRFIVKVGNKIKSLTTIEIMFFQSQNKATYSFTHDGRKYLIDYSLDKLDSLLDPQDYFRVNRNYMINYKALLDMVSYSSSRIKINLIGSQDNEIIVSREKVKSFKEWLDR